MDEKIAKTFELTYSGRFFEAADHVPSGERPQILVKQG